jgi:hypothetical protein
MRATRLTATFTTGAFGLALGIAVLALPAPARAGDDDTPIDTKILQGVMHSLGLKDGTETGIDYRERAPLVLPSNKDLPPPQNGDSVIANDPAWPKDPDIARAKALKKMNEAHRADSSERLDAHSRPLLPSQLEPGGQANGIYRGPQGADNASASANGTSRLAPNELGYKGNFFGSMFGHGEENAKFTGEPPRASLTDPPAGYQVPSPDQPYGMGKAGPIKPDNYYLSRGTDYNH